MRDGMSFPWAGTTSPCGPACGRSRSSCSAISCARPDGWDAGTLLCAQERLFMHGSGMKDSSPLTRSSARMPTRSSVSRSASPSSRERPVPIPMHDGAPAGDAPTASRWPSGWPRTPRRAGASVAGRLWPAAMTMARSRAKPRRGLASITSPRAARTRTVRVGRCVGGGERLVDHETAARTDRRSRTHCVRGAAHYRRGAPRARRSRRRRVRCRFGDLRRAVVRRTARRRGFRTGPEMVTQPWLTAGDHARSLA